MRLTVDRDRCFGHGRCYDTAPLLVDSDEDGDPIVLVDPLGADDVELARRVVRACPERALSVIEA